MPVRIDDFKSCQRHKMRRLWWTTARAVNAQIPKRGSGTKYVGKKVPAQSDSLDLRGASAPATDTGPYFSDRG
jgi:hypothetical protein